MADSEAISGMNTTVNRNGVEIAEVFDIGGPELTAETIDVTHLKSPKYWREFKANLKDGGELKLSVNFIIGNPTHDAATGVLSPFTGDGPPPVDDWDIIFPDEVTTWSFRGPVTGFKTGMQIDDKLQAEITVKLSGDPTLM